MSKAVYINRGRLCVHTRYFDKVKYVMVCQKGKVSKVFFPPIIDRPRGKWVGNDNDGFVCSVCCENNDYAHDEKLDIYDNFCPNCGADMREEQ